MIRKSLYCITVWPFQSHEFISNIHHSGGNIQGYVLRSIVHMLVATKRKCDHEEEKDKCIPYQLQWLFLQLQITNKKTAVETNDLTKILGWDHSEGKRVKENNLIHSNMHWKWYTMIILYNHCSGTVLNSAKHKHASTESYMVPWWSKK